MEQSMIYKKMSDVMKDVGFVGKDGTNKAQGYKFRGVDQFCNALYPVLCKHNVFMVPRVTQESHELKEVERSSGKVGVDKHVHLMVEYTFFAEDGSSVDVGPLAAEGLDSGDKATNKALSAALKYALIQTFCIPTEDMAEADNESPVIQPKKAFAPTVGKIEKPAVEDDVPYFNDSLPTTVKPTSATVAAAPIRKPFMPIKSN